MKRVLSLDGGGIRGLITARVLAEFERRAGKPVSQMFHLIGGVSTGGILAAMLTAPDRDGKPLYTAKSIEGFYVSEGPKIFELTLGRRFATLFNLTDVKYSDYGLRNALERYLGKFQLTDALTPLVISAFDLEAQQPFFFKSEMAKSNPTYRFLMADAAHASSAAPTYFNPAVLRCVPYLRNGKTLDYCALVDGGVFATNPAMCLYAEARRMWFLEDGPMVVSIGTGQLAGERNYKDFVDKGSLQWVQPLLDMMFQGSSITVNYQLNWLQAKHYRLTRNLTIASGAVDDASAPNLKALQNEADLLIKEQSDVIDDILEQLA